MTLREKLERVRDIVRERGTLKGSLGRKGGPVCLVGAVAEVEDLMRHTTRYEWAASDLAYPGSSNPVIQALSNGLPKSVRGKRGAEVALTDYHDSHTKAASVALVTRAIKALDAEDAAS